MDVLIRFGFSIEDIKNMMDTNIEIDNINDNNLSMLINILKNIGCFDMQIKNILVANPFYLNRKEEDVRKLINKMEKINMNNLQTVFDSNPFLLNLDVKEFDSIVRRKKSEGLDDDEIVDFICYELV